MCETKWVKQRAFGSMHYRKIKEWHGEKERVRERERERDMDGAIASGNNLTQYKTIGEWTYRAKLLLGI